MHVGEVTQCSTRMVKTNCSLCAPRGLQTALRKSLGSATIHGNSLCAPRGLQTVLRKSLGSASALHAGYVPFYGKSLGCWCCNGNLEMVTSSHLRLDPERPNALSKFNRNQVDCFSCLRRNVGEGGNRNLHNTWRVSQPFAGVPETAHRGYPNRLRKSLGCRWKNVHSN